MLVESILLLKWLGNRDNGHKVDHSYSTCQDVLNSLYVIAEENKVTFRSNVH